MNTAVKAEHERIVNIDTITAEENKSAYQKNQDRKSARAENNDLLLDEAIAEAIEESGLEPTAHLTDEIKKRFGHNGEKVYGTSIFRSIPAYIASYQGKVQQVAAGITPELTVQDRIDIQKREKQAKFEEMVYWSKSGDLSKYRKARAEWSAL